LLEYWAKHAKSLDGLPSLTSCFKLPFIPESAPDRRVAPIKPAAKKETADEILQRLEELENEQKVLPVVGASLTRATVADTVKLARDPNRDWNITIGFVIGLFAAALANRLIVLLRSHV
jgi:tetrahydromethanopterin S-methyltransferase subunit G